MVRLIRRIGIKDDCDFWSRGMVTTREAAEENTKEVEIKRSQRIRAGHPLVAV